MRRVIEFERQTTMDSLGRNGFLMTTGCELEEVGPWEDDTNEVSIQPVTTRGEAGRARVVIDSASAADVAVFLFEAYCKVATRDTALAVLRRFEAVANGDPDPVRVHGRDPAPVPPRRP